MADGCMQTCLDRGHDDLSHQYNFGLFLTHYVSINTVMNVSKTGRFLEQSTQSDVIWCLSLFQIYDLLHRIFVSQFYINPF